MVNERNQTCVDSIRQIIYFHGLMLLFIKKYPEIGAEIDSQIEQFINDKSKRTKENLSNLALMLVYTLFSEKFNFASIAKAYFEEQLDRQVFWILLKIPELDDSNLRDIRELDESRVEISFTSQIIGYQITLFFHDYHKAIRSKFKSNAGLQESLEKNSCKLEAQLEDQILSAFGKSKNEVKSYSTFFKKIGLPEKSQQELNSMLKEAVKNSREKKYHGDMDEMIGLPEKKADQFKLYQKHLPDLLDHVVEGKIKF